MADLATLYIEVRADGVVNATQDLGDFAKQAEKTQKSTDTLGTSFSKLAKVLTGLFVANRIVREFQQLSSVYTDMTSRINLATKSADEAAEALDRIKASADRTYGSLTSVAEIFLRNSAAFSDLGYSTKQQLDFVEAMNDALVISGAKGQRAESVINALSKALMSGTLRGENWNTVLQQGGRVVEALAEGLGVTIAQLRVMASEGQLTSEKVLTAITSQMEKLREESESMPATIEDAWTRLNNQLIITVGRFNETSGAADLAVQAIDKLNQGLKYLTENLESDSDNWVKNLARIPAFLVAMFNHIKVILNGLGESLGNTFFELAESIKNLDFSGLGDRIAEENRRIEADTAAAHAAIREQYEITTGQADYLTASLDDQTDATIYASNAAKELAAAMGLVSGAKMPETLGEAIKYLADYTAQTKEAAAETRALAAAMASASLGKILAGSVEASMKGDIATATELMGMYGKYSKRAAEATKTAEEQANRVRGGGGRKKSGGGRKKSGSGRSGGGSSSQDENQREFESLLSYLQTSEEKIAESYAKRKELILKNTQFESEQQQTLLTKLEEKHNAELKQIEEAKQREKDALYVGLLSEEESLLQSYERRKQQILESTAVTLEEKHDLEMRLTKQYNDELAALEQERIKTQLEAAGTLFDGLAGLAKSYAGEQSTAYRVLFAISKGFSIAQAALSIATGVAKAQELGFPANLAEMARVAAVGASIMSQINGSSYSGAYDKGGYIQSGKFGLVGEYGPEIVHGPANVISRQETAALTRKALSGNGESGGGKTISVNATYVLQDKTTYDQFRSSRRQVDADLAKNIRKAS